jgi:hypothetical protein
MQRGDDRSFVEQPARWPRTASASTPDGTPSLTGLAAAVF